MLIKKIFSLRFFLLGILLGLFMLMIFPNNGKIVTIYPSKENSKSVQYVDKAKSCFEFNVEEVDCPNNPYDVKIIPIQ